jgi:hypothetical protein
MTSIKKFDEFLFEGSYDKLTGEICSAVMRKIKETNNGEEFFDGIKIIHGPEDSISSFGNMIDNEQYLEIDHFVDNVSGIDCEVNLTVIRDESPEFRGNFMLDGFTDDENSIIYIYVYLTPGSEPSEYSEISASLRDVVRHEIEHLTQRGWNEKPGKRMRKNDVVRNKITSNPELYYRYFKLKDEIPANLQGLYSEAKTRKIPFKKVVNDYLDKKVESGIIPYREKTIIYRLWKSVAQKIGGLPPL